MTEPRSITMVEGDTPNVLYKRHLMKEMDLAKRTALVHSLPARCNAKTDEWRNAYNRVNELNTAADAYLKGNGPRQVEWEMQFVNDFAVAIRIYRDTTAAKFDLDESYKAVFGTFPGYWDDMSHAVWKVTRLVRTEIELKDGLVEVEDTSREEKTNAPVADVAATRANPTTQQTATKTGEQTTPATQVAKTGRKKTVGEDDKKTVEKGKDESGVEDS
jgi:hypothetical protein